MFGQKALVNRAVSFPENDFRVAQSLWRAPAPREVRIPDHHLSQRDSHSIASIAAQVLIGKKDNLGSLAEPPSECARRIRRCTYQPAMLATEGLYRSTRIHVGEWSNSGTCFIRNTKFDELLPAIFDLADLCHVCH